MKTLTDMGRSVGATAYKNRHYPDRPTHTFTVDQLEAFAALVRMQERESCAMQCIEIGGMGDGYDCATEIRK